MERYRMKQRILILGTYPIHPAMHGGQKRTAAIIEKYKQLGHDVRYVSLCTPRNYPHYSSSDLRIGEIAMKKAVSSLPSTTFIELAVCRELVNDEGIVKKFKKIVDTFRPTLVEYEQGYCYEFSKAIDYKPLSEVPMIFSSHNVEWQMKREIALSEGCLPEDIEAYVNAVRNLESELIEKSQHTIVVTEADAVVYRQMAPENTEKIIIAHNGINPLYPTKDEEQHWRDIFHKEGIEKVIVYVASAHPPNLHGFRHLVDGVGFLPFTTRIIIAGGVSDILRNMTKRTSDIQLATLQNRVMLVGRLTEERLQGLISVADAIMLPVLEGGGSNLKTAEAIIADKPVVATSHAYRAYEIYEKLPNTYLADTPEEFQRAILNAIQEPVKKRSAEQYKIAQEVVWEKCLSNLDTLFTQEGQ